MPSFHNGIIVSLRLFLCLLLIGFALLIAPLRPVAAQMRVVTYNTREQAHSSLSTILEAIGEESTNGVAKPIDVLALQEQTFPNTTTQAIVDLLNNIYGAGTYDRGTLLGGSTGAGRPALIYNTQTVDLISEGVASNTSGSGGARQTLRYQMRPVGYDASADFYVYNSHYKASTGSTNENRREVEAIAVRNNADFFGEGTSIIYAGDFNLYTSSEDAYQELLSAGPGQAHDPLNPSNAFQPWNNNSGFAVFHSQSPCLSGCGVGGGVDSRFDFQLVSGEVIDDEGFSLLDNSYHTFGNNGSSYNEAINGSNTIVFNGITSFTKTQVLNALATATDHLPVVADYQVPAILDTLTASIPATLEVGELFNLGVTVFNDADVVAAIGADELDYSLSTSGNVSGAFSGSDLALGGGNFHNVLFDTSTAGLKSGSITVSTSSQSAANNLVTIPISFEVLAATLAGDYNGDGFVDAADYTVWRDGGPLQNETASLGVVDAADYTAWVGNFGASASTATAVPEPTSLATLLLALTSVALRRRA